MLDVLRPKFERLDREKETAPSSFKSFPLAEENSGQAVEVWSGGHLTDIPISELALFEETDKVNPLIAQHVREAMARVKSGDLSDVEQILTHQLFCLNSLFEHFATAAVETDNIKHQAFYANHATSFQTACRQTAATITEIKKPIRSATLIKQQQNLLRLESASDQADIGDQGKVTPPHPELETVDAQAVPSKQSFAPGERVHLPSGREGVVRAAPWHEPGFTFIEFPGGLHLWYNTHILSPVK